MKITEVRISPAKGGKVRAFASIVVDDCFIVNDLRVVEGKEEQMYVTMPARKVRSGQMRDIAYPLNSETRQMIEDRVLEEFRAAVESRAVPDKRVDKGRKERQHPLDRLAAKLFSDDFWTADQPRAEAARGRNQGDA
jgi:stage V sporulation protein G